MLWGKVQLVRGNLMWEKVLLGGGGRGESTPKLKEPQKKILDQTSQMLMEQWIEQLGKQKAYEVVKKYVCCLKKKDHATKTKMLEKQLKIYL